MAKAKVKSSAGITFGKSDFVKLKQEHKEYARAYRDALYYAQYELSNKQLAKETVTYAKKNPDFAKASLSLLPDTRFEMVGKYCFILNNGGELRNEVKSKIDSILADMCGEANKKAEEKRIATRETQSKSLAPVLTIQDRLRLKAAEVCAEFDGEVDELIKNPRAYKVDQFKPLSAMNRAQLKQGHLRYVVGFYENDIKELDEYLNGSDTDIAEAYSYLGKAGVRKLKKLFEEIVNSANMIISQARATRKPAKRKAKPVEKVVEKLKYKKSDQDLKLASVNPVDIVGAQLLWVYNTKNRKLGCYRAFDETGLSIKGTTIENASVDASKQKTVRKPNEQIHQFTRGTRAAFEKNFKALKAIDTKMSPRINEHIVLLKVFK